MAATLTQDRFTGPEWIFERKFDGIRLLAYKRGDSVQLFSRNRLLQNDAYPAVVQAVARLPVRDAILDGEATGVWGKHGRVAYHVFDAMWLDGRDITQLPIEERRALIHALPFDSPLRRVTELRGSAPWEEACREGWEGVIAKRRGSLYEHRRSPQWLKMKCEATQELVIGGFTEPQGSRVGLGALLVGYFAAEGAAGQPPVRATKTAAGHAAPTTREFVFAGKVGTGFDNKMLRDLRTRLDALEIPHPPFTHGSGLPRLGAHWVRPEIVVQVAFIEWTAHGKLRHPRLLGVRIDKDAGDVVREAP
jgi:ATP-dependent DNA ligase